MTTTQASFQNFWTQDLISGVEEVIHSFHSQKKRKIYFFSESHLDFLFLIQGGSFKKRMEGLFESLKKEDLTIQTCIFIYFLLSEQKISAYIFDSKKKILFPIAYEDGELNFGENPYRFLLTFLQKNIEEAHEILNLQDWSEYGSSICSV